MSRRPSCPSNQDRHQNTSTQHGGGKHPEPPLRHPLRLQGQAPHESMIKSPEQPKTTTLTPQRNMAEANIRSRRSNAHAGHRHHLADDKRSTMPTGRVDQTLMREVRDSTTLPPRRGATIECTAIAGINRGRCRVFTRSSPNLKSRPPIRRSRGSSAAR